MTPDPQPQENPTPLTPGTITRRQFVAATVGAAAVGLAAKPAPRLRLHIVGSGCPVPTRTRYGSAFILEAGTEWVMVDCGPATTWKMTQMKIAPGKISHLFFTHHHFDHNVDFPCFALTRWDLSHGTEPPLKVYGPSPTRAFVERLLGAQGAFFDDLNARIKHPVSVELFKRRGGKPPRPAPAIDAQDVGAGKIAQSDAWTATAVRVHHVEPRLESLAFRFDTPSGSIVFAGDCGDCESLRQLTQGADTLVIACVFIGPTKVYGDIITGTPQIAEIGRACGVKRIILSHAWPGVDAPEAKEKAIADVARTYHGTVLFPEELTTVDLTKQSADPKTS
jgi:ribonuclease BN (tRNA processing enzyme)